MITCDKQSALGETFCLEAVVFLYKDDMFFRMESCSLSHVWIKNSHENGHCIPKP